VFPVPDWISTADDQNYLARQRFYLKLAALFASEGGSIAALAERIGCKADKLSSYMWHDANRIPPELALSIERVVSRVVVRREDFRPDLYDGLYDPPASE